MIVILLKYCQIFDIQMASVSCDPIWLWYFFTLSQCETLIKTRHASRLLLQVARRY
jgi:hypothetical protein